MAGWSWPWPVIIFTVAFGGAATSRRGGEEAAASAALRPGSTSLADTSPADARERSLPAWLPALAFAATLVGLWLLIAPRTPDLAAQAYRTDLFARDGMVLWDARWYAGHEMVGYSLLFPPLAALVGMRLLGALAALASTLLFARLAERAWGAAARWPSVLFAVGAAADVWIGRLSFALGASLALGAALALVHRRSGLAAVLSLASAAASPVAGLLLALGAASVSLARRSRREVLVLGVPVAAVVVPLALLFGEGGFEPFPIRSFAASALVALAFLWALPREARVLRLGGRLYLLALVACLLVHSPMGSNVARYGALLAGPLLLGALLSHRGRVGLRGAAALCLILTWVVWGPARENAAVAGDPATSASYYRPLERFLATQPGPVRIEVPLTRSHWEAALLAPHVSLARGWEKQLDMRYDRVLLGAGLDAASYARWLRSQAVSYVALPDAALDPPSAREGALVRAGLPYLHEVWSNAHWKLYRVTGAEPLLSGPGHLLALGSDTLRLRADAPGALLVRVHYSRYLQVAAGSGCVGPGRGGWTRVRALRPGAITVAARFSLAAALSGGGERCRGGSG
jgi:hypothetical protein